MSNETTNSVAPSKDLAAKSIIVETENGDIQCRVKIDGRSLNLPGFASIQIKLGQDGTGEVAINIPTHRIKVLPAGKRLSNRTIRRRMVAETQSPAVESEAAADE